MSISKGWEGRLPPVTEMTGTRRVVALVAAVLAFATVLAGDAGATPGQEQKPNPVTFSDVPVPMTISCADGTTMQVTGGGSGTFAPAHEVGGARVFIPVEFGPANAIFVFADGSMAHADWFFTVSKGGPGDNGKNLSSCLFTWTGEMWDAMVSFRGLVKGKVATA